MLRRVQNDRRPIIVDDGSNSCLIGHVTDHWDEFALAATITQATFDGVQRIFVAFKKTNNPASRLLIERVNNWSQDLAV